MGISDIITDLTRPLRSGERLKRDLGLNKFKFVWIQKVINSSLNIFIVTVDSRYPNVYIDRPKLSKLTFSTINRIKNRGGDFEFGGFSLTPSIDLDEFNGNVQSNSIIFFRDLAGHYFMNNRMYENYTLDIPEENNELRYKALYERVMGDFKAWFSPSMDKLYQFDTNLLHSEKALEYFRLDDESALDRGYIRIYSYNNTINIESDGIPNDRIFSALQYSLKYNSRYAKTLNVIWDTNKGVYYFSKQSFFFAEDFFDGSKKM